VTSFDLPQAHHVRKSNEFKHILQKGKKTKAHKFCIYALENQLQFSRIGFIVSKTVGNAPKRNSIKRLWKEAFRLERGQFENPCDFIIRFFPGYHSQNLDELRNAIKDLGR
jgi:ribonuclease P protein component